MFNFFLCDLFLIIDNIDSASYADDNTPYTFDESAEKVVDKLEIVAKILFKWFSDNQMKANPDKCHLLISSASQSKLKVGNVAIKSRTCEKLLGIKFDNKLRLSAHVEDLCKKVSRKIHAFARVASYMTVLKRRILMNAFFRSQFSYCPLVYMCQSRTLNNKMNRIHERCLRTAYNDKFSNFQNLLDQDRSVSVHTHNLQTLAIEMYEVSKGWVGGYLAYFNMYSY